MNQLTAQYLRSRFREYYLMASMEAPPDLPAREWGFLFFDQPGMRRHRAFFSRMELVDFIRATVPAHVYHSAAYYIHPGAPTMKEKLWQGADLIFDLDADHLRRSPKSYGEMLDLVKKETAKLLEFLMDDFGLDQDQVSVVFSGGRGYHIHVRDPRVRPLPSEARREIVDYLTGRGLDLDRFISTVQVSGDAGRERAESLRIPSARAAGWGGRINRAVQSFVRYLQALGEDEAVKTLAGVKGVGRKTAKRFYREIAKEGTAEKISAGNLDFFRGSSGLWGLLLPYLAEEGISMGPFIDEMRGETDEPVTADIRRLIRFPESLHGGTGLRVTALPADALQSFQPLRDAVVFDRRPVQVLVEKPTVLEMKGERFDLETGPARLPGYAAIFVMARGAAELDKDYRG
ncbi:MAG: DNA primase small subunit PriS [Methanosaeta sp. PtaB.Bin039]|nr:MAG: DNA primase small subunit PriS [Methanosaeta sp. PtaB.Bin039]OPY44106.1 MAG: DNA primase small subunit PriS [Methanosaeta sp. PtaU1.Bin028]HOT06055.1 DNA primase catalytic subunit PriS [Methanotrichaceae archaeon]HQF16295.1 DNA primase catalytic subunit PriS [Methanotrichaceae archaeon]HQI90067.1 DNA primase catalytic subunit PriS [Methanotrichaceae archaeon]